MKKKNRDEFISCVLIVDQGSWHDLENELFLIYLCPYAMLAVRLGNLPRIDQEKNR